MKVERKRVFHPSGGPILVKRSEQDQADVNLIMDSWIHAGAAVAGNLNPAPGRYGDFSSGLDYQTALNAVMAAQSEFMKLPPKIRDHVENDPGKLLDMWFDPARRSELEELGLVAKAEPVVAQEPPGAPEAVPGVVEPEVDESGSDDPSEARSGSQKSADPAAGLFD